MKIIRLSTFSLLTALTSFGQNKPLPKEAQAFKEYTSRLEDDRRAATEKKEYLRANTFLK